MTPVHAHDDEQLFAEALELGPAERDALLSRVEAADPAQARRLGRFLQAFESSPDFLAQPVPVSLSELAETLSVADEPDTASLVGRRVGNYRLVRRLGVGGMGVVYEAEQEKPKRPVALKLIRSLQLDAAAVRRFETEAAALARLHHPGVAQLYEGGVTEIEGQTVPYFAMELIREARPVVGWLQEYEPDRRRRIEIFARVCDAVQHAHEQGVVHRDLKPANILVGTDGRPKIIDFGIARVTEDEHRSTEHTRTGMLLGTINYMSPEQLAAGAREIDRRTDVYTLGVILYEVLCGASPYELHQLSLPHAMRTVIEQEPAVPAAHGVSLDTELETTLLKAMAKSPDDRYGSVRELADDLRRYLDNKPILARRPGRVRRLMLAARRRPTLTAALLVGVALLAIGSFSSALIWFRGEQARLAEQQQVAALRSELEGVRARLGSTGTGPDERDLPFAADLVASAREGLADAETDAQRQRVLGWAISTLGRMEQRAGAAPELMRSLAETYSDLGDLYGLEWNAGADQVERSTDAYRRSVAILTELLEASPGDEDLRRSLVSARVQLAQSLRKMQKADEAREVAAMAVLDADRLHAAAPEDDATARLLVRSLWSRSDAVISLQDTELGLADSLRAVDIAKGLLARRPDDPRLISLSAWSLFRAGLWYEFHAEQLKPALEHEAAAADLWLRLVREFPASSGHVNELLIGAWPEVQHRLEYGEMPAALARGQQIVDAAADAMTDPVAESFPINFLSQRQYALIETLRKAGRQGEAEAVCRAWGERLRAMTGAGPVSQAKLSEALSRAEAGCLAD